jgi:hypothetical protein
MKKVLIIALVSCILFFTSCARGISPYDASHGKAKCGRYIK